MYEYKTIADLVRLADQYNISVSDVVIRREMEEHETSEQEIRQMMDAHIEASRASVKEGLEDTSRSMSGLTGNDSRTLRDREPNFLGETAKRAMAYAVAVAEGNGKMRRIVACPTAGSCGIVPGVVFAVGEMENADKEAYQTAYFTAAGIGAVIARNASVAGAVGGCQAECGSAAAMAAGAAVAMIGGTAKQIEQAVAICLKNVLGLVCDPVAGLVEVPCVKRNGMYAVHALSAAEMAMAGVESFIPVDEVIQAMDAIGRAIPASLRETADGGLAKTPTGQAAWCRISGGK